MRATHVNTSTLPYIATASYYLSFIILGFTTAASGPSLLKLAEHTSSEIDRISLIFVLSSLGYLIGSFLGGRAYDRFSSHKLLAITTTIMAVSCIFIPISNSLVLLLAAMFMNGFSAGILDVGCNTLMIWTHGEKAGPFLNGLHFFFGVGSLITPLLLAQVLIRTGDIHWLYWSFTIVSMPLAIWLWFLPEAAAHRQHEDNTGNSSFPAAPVILMVTLFLFYVGLELGFGNWIYAYAITLGLGTEITSAYLTSAFWGSFTFGRMLGIWISTRLRPQTILIIDISGCAIFTILILLWKDSSLVLWIGTLGLGISLASFFPTLIILAGERMQITGTITGWFLVGSGAGSMLLPWLIGQIFARTGPEAMITVLLIAILSLSLFLLLFLRLKIKPPQRPIPSAK